MQAKDGVTLSTAWMQWEQQQQLCSKARYCPVDTPLHGAPFKLSSGYTRNLVV